MKGRVSQQWSFSSGVKPGDGKPTVVLSAMRDHSLPGGLCWEIAECRDGGGINCKNGCKALPAAGTGCPENCPSKDNICGFNGMFRFNRNGTITTGMDMSCVTLSAAGAPVLLAPCDGKPHQVFEVVLVGNDDVPAQQGVDMYTIIGNGGLCIDNLYVTTGPGDPSTFELVSAQEHTIRKVFI